jgi:lactoylglutathione lyase
VIDEGNDMPAKKKSQKKSQKRTVKKASVRRKSTRKTSAKRTSARPAKKRARPKAPEGFRLRAVAPSLTVSDLERSLSWYRDVLGFVVTERWERDGTLAGVEVAAGSVSFYLGQDDWKKGRDRVKGEGFRLYCTTQQDVDRLAEQIRSRGGSLLQEPHDQPWGGRAFAVADPDGFKLTISRE